MLLPENTCIIIWPWKILMAQAIFCQFCNQFTILHNLQEFFTSNFNQNEKQNSNLNFKWTLFCLQVPCIETLLYKSKIRKKKKIKKMYSIDWLHLCWRKIKYSNRKVCQWVVLHKHVKSLNIFVKWKKLNLLLSVLTKMKLKKNLMNVQVGMEIFLKFLTLTCKTRACCFV